MTAPACTAVVEAEGTLRPGAATALVPWWSFTKTLLAAAVLRLAEDGRLSLDAPMAGRPYSLRMVLQHRAGIGDYGALPSYGAAVAAGGEPWSDAELFAQASPDRLLFRPGEGWAYSNVGYLLVRRAIEAAFGAPLDHALADLVLRPLGLHQTRVAVTRADMARTVFPSIHSYHPGWAFHGVVIGPAAEAALALHRLLRGDLLAPESLGPMLDRHPIGGAIPGRPWLSTGYGLGLMVGTFAHPAGGAPIRVAGHSAGGAGSFGAVYQDMDTGITATAFTAGKDEARAEYLTAAALAGR